MLLQLALVSLIFQESVAMSSFVINRTIVDLWTPPPTNTGDSNRSLDHELTIHRQNQLLKSSKDNAEGDGDDDHVEENKSKTPKSHIQASTTSGHKGWIYGGFVLFFLLMIGIAVGAYYVIAKHRTKKVQKKSSSAPRKRSTSRRRASKR